MGFYEKTLETFWGIITTHMILTILSLLAQGIQSDNQLITQILIWLSHFNRMSYLNNNIAASILLTAISLTLFYLLKNSKRREWY